MHAPLDPFGALLSIVGLSALVYGIIEGPDNGWMSTQTVGDVRRSRSAILAGFIAWELRVKEPMLDLRFFRNPRFTAATTAITLAFFAMFGSYFIIAQYMQFVRGYSPLGTGLRMLPWALAYMLAAMQSARLVERFGQRRVVSSGLFIAGAGLAWMSTSSAGSSYWLFAGSLMTMALGMGITTAPSTGRDHAVTAVAQGGRGFSGERHHA